MHLLCIRTGLIANLLNLTNQWVRLGVAVLIHRRWLPDLDPTVEYGIIIPHGKNTYYSAYQRQLV